MELQTENTLPLNPFQFPEGITFQIYSHLPLEAFWLWSLTSKRANKEYYQFFNSSFTKTNTIIYDFIDNKLSKLEEAYYYNPQTFTFLLKKQSVQNAKGEAILSKKWVKDNQAFQKFAHDIYSKYQYDELSLECIFTIRNKKFIHLEVMSDKTLSYCVYHGSSVLATGVVELDPTLETLSKPVTLDMLKPYEAKLRHELGLKELNLFLEIFERAMNDGPHRNRFNWEKNTPAIEVPYLKLFNNPLFQTYYLNGYITFNFLCDYITTHGAGIGLERNIMSYCLDLKECSLNPGSLSKYANEFDLLILLRQHPKPLGYCYSDEELAVLREACINELINEGYATLEECLQHFEKLIPKWDCIIKMRIGLPPKISETNPTLIEFICKDMSQEDKKNLHFLEFFCKDLAENPQKVLKGAAILELYEYIDQRAMEEKNSSLPSLFKNPFAYSCEDKIKSALALISVLFELQNKSLSERDIKILTHGEDRLTKIVKTEVLEPLELDSLDELNPKTIEFDIFV